VAQTEARQADKAAASPTMPPSYKTLWVTAIFGLLAAGGGLFFAQPDPTSLAFVTLAVLIFYGALGSGLRPRLLTSPAYGPAAGSSPDADRILQLIGEHGLRAPDKSAALRVPPNEVLRICPQLVNDAVQLGGLQHVQALLISLGLVGTFVGLSMGLQGAVPCIDPNDAGFEACKTAAVQALGEAGQQLSDADKAGAAMQRGMSELLGGARLAFSKSIAGVGLGVLYLFAIRDVEAQLRRRRRSFVLSVLNRCEVRTSDDVMRDHLTQLVDTLATRFKASMSDQTALTTAASSLAGAAVQIEGSVNKLSAAATNLGGLSAAAIGENVGRAMDRTVTIQLKPALDGIGQQLVAVKQLVEQVERYKAENDKVVTERLEQLTATLRVEVLQPMGAEVQRAAAQTERAALAINNLAPLIQVSAAATAKAAAGTTVLGQELQAFQSKTLVLLQEHNEKQSAALTRSGDAIVRAVEAAVRGLTQQEAAFKQAAALAERTFTAQTAAVTAAGQKSAEAIQAAGATASEVLTKVQEQLVGGVQSQIEELRRLLAGLKELSSTFAVTDQAQRDAVGQLATQTSKTLTTIHSVSREVQGASDAARLEREKLQSLLAEVVSKHGALLRTESAALAQALDQLYQAVNAAELVNQRAAQLNPQPPVGRRVGPAGGPAERPWDANQCWLDVQRGAALATDRWRLWRDDQFWRVRVAQPQPILAQLAASEVITRELLWWYSQPAAQLAPSLRRILDGAGDRLRPLRDPVFLGERAAFEGVAPRELLRRWGAGPSSPVRMTAALRSYATGLCQRAQLGKGDAALSESALDELLVAALEGEDLATPWWTLEDAADGPVERAAALALKEAVPAGMWGMLRKTRALLAEWRRSRSAALGDDGAAAVAAIDGFRASDQLMRFAELLAGEPYSFAQEIWDRQARKEEFTKAEHNAAAILKRVGFLMNYASAVRDCIILADHSLPAERLPAEVTVIRSGQPSAGGMFNRIALLIGAEELLVKLKGADRDGDPIIRRFRREATAGAGKLDARVWTQRAAEIERGAGPRGEIPNDSWTMAGEKWQPQLIEHLAGVGLLPDEGLQLVRGTPSWHQDRTKHLIEQLRRGA
jgi:hypothetical protein